MKNTCLKTLAVLSILGASSLFASGADLYKRCAGCHGVNGEKKALGKSETITAWEVEKTISSLKGYKDGSYGGAMKGIMKGQVAKLNNDEIKELAEYIATFK